jgi:uncharacterized protein (DUF983 family)
MLEEIQNSLKKGNKPYLCLKLFLMHPHRNRSLLSAILGMKCPKCRRGNMFKNKSILPLNEMMKMPERCPVCGQLMDIQPGFYFGSAYVSYALCIALCAFNFIWFALLIGVSTENNSIYWYLGITVGMLILLQPWLMRMSRVLFLNMFVKYDHRYDQDEEAMNNNPKIFSKN